MSAFKAWLSTPYDAQGMSIPYWVLLLVFVGILSYGWHHIFQAHLKINSSL